MSSESVRYRVFNEIVAAMQAIVAPTYHNDVTVHQIDPPEPDASGAHVVVGLGSEELEDVTAGGRYTVVWTVEIDGYLPKASATLARDLLYLSQDIRDAVLAAKSDIMEEAGTGGQAVMIRLSGGEYGEGLLHEDGGMAQVREYVEITYKTNGAF